MGKKERVISEEDLTEGRNANGTFSQPLAVALGGKGGDTGGHSRAEVLTDECRSLIAKKAAAVKWNNDWPDYMEDRLQEELAKRV